MSGCVVLFAGVTANVREFLPHLASGAAIVVCKK